MWNVPSGAAQQLDCHFSGARRGKGSKYVGVLGVLSRGKLL